MSAVVKLGVSGNDDSIALIEFEDGTTLMVGQTNRVEAGYYAMATYKSINPVIEQVWERR